MVEASSATRLQEHVCECCHGVRWVEEFTPDLESEEAGLLITQRSLYIHSSRMNRRLSQGASLTRKRLIESIL